MTAPLLEIEDLRVSFRAAGARVRAVQGLSLRVARGETLAIVGESGSGKTVSMQALMRLLDSPPAEIKAARMSFDGTDLTTLPDRDWAAWAGDRVAMVFQDALTALNPVFTVGWQIAEMFQVHRPAMTRAELHDASAALLRQVGIPEPERRLDDYPHQFSGGMRQRAMIAMAIALDPELLIADEPTTALDVTVQAQIMDLLRALSTDRGMSMILITHDLGLVAESADRVVIMYAGQVMETGTVAEVLGTPRHPYTLGLLASRPEAGTKGGRLRPIPGSPPDLSALPDGCPFRPRCAFARPACASGEMPEVTVPSGQTVRCLAVADDPAGDHPLVGERGVA
jgi:oligopeptide transport system ATP-binding protein